MARKKIEIDKSNFEKLCGLQCTKEEISGFFDCSEDTIERWCRTEYGDSFAVVFSKKRSPGKISLRRTQWRLAEKNVTMAIWLGKQYLGQSENARNVSVEFEDDGLIKALRRSQNKLISDEAMLTDG